MSETTGCEQATSLASAYGLEPQREEETASDFRRRISGILRDRGLLVEAHECLQNCRWDAEDGAGAVLTGLIGAMAMALQGTTYGTHGATRVETERMAGIVVENPKPEMSPETALLMIELFEGRRP